MKETKNKEAEEKEKVFFNIFKIIYQINLETKKTAHIEQIKKTYLLKFNEKESIQIHWKRLNEEIPKVFKMDDRTYVIGIRKILKMLFSKLEYELSFKPQGNAARKIETEKERLKDILRVINNQEFDAETHANIRNKYSLIYDKIFATLSQIRKKLELSFQFTERFLITEKKIFLDPSIETLLPDPIERTLAIDQVLDLIHSHQLAFIGKFIDPETQAIEYFYFDLGLITEEKNALLVKKIQNGLRFQRNNKILKQVIEEIKKFESVKKFKYYFQGFKNINDSLKKLKFILLETHSPIEIVFEEILKQISKLNDDYLNLLTSYKQTSFIKAEVAQIKSYLTSCTEILQTLKKQTKESSLLFKIFIKSYIQKENFLNITEEHDIIQIAYKTANLPKDMSIKKRIISEMWEDFTQALKQHLSRYDIYTSYRENDNKKSDIIIHYELLSIYKNQNQKTIYLFDGNYEMEIDENGEMKKKPLATWSPYQEYIPLLIRGILAYYKTLNIFSYI